MFSTAASQNDHLWVLKILFDIAKNKNNFFLALQQWEMNRKNFKLNICYPLNFGRDVSINHDIYYCSMISLNFNVQWIYYHHLAVHFDWYCRSPNWSKGICNYFQWISNAVKLSRHMLQHLPHSGWERILHNSSLMCSVIVDFMFSCLTVSCFIQVPGNERDSILISFATKSSNAGQVTSKLHVIELGAQPGQNTALITTTCSLIVKLFSKIVGQICFIWLSSVLLIC